MNWSHFGQVVEPRGRNKWVECIGGPLDGDALEVARCGWVYGAVSACGGAYHLDARRMPWSYRWVPAPPVQPQEESR